MAGLSKPGPQLRPMPADFGDYCESKSQRWLMRHYKAGEATVRRWREEYSGKVDRRFKAMPSNFAEVARKMCRADIMRHFDIGERLLERYLRETGVTPPRAQYKTKAQRPVPADFREVAPSLNMRMAQQRWNTGYDQTRRWFDETGIEPATIRADYERKVRPIVYKNWSRVNHAPTSRAYSPHDEAADILRAHAPTYRCDERGVQDAKGSMWRFGNALLDGDELLARAERYRKIRA